MNKPKPPVPGTATGHGQELATFIDEAELRNRVPVSRKTLFHWRKAGKIPFVRVSGRRVLFHWPSVESALLRLQKNGQA